MGRLGWCVAAFEPRGQPGDVFLEHQAARFDPGCGHGWTVGSGIRPELSVSWHKCRRARRQGEGDLAEAARSSRHMAGLVF
jgi:hypothetical protein